jgi:excisionase family DNA binding protein
VVDHQIEVTEQLMLVALGPVGAADIRVDEAAGVAGEPRLPFSDRKSVPTAGPSRAGELSSLSRLLLTPEEAAKLLAVGRTTLYGLLQSGELPSVRIGACRRIPFDAVRAFVDGLRTRPDDNERSQ